MGVKLKELLPKTNISLQSLAGKSIAIDAYNALYQFLAIIRQPNGTPLQDRKGRVTSHLSGLLYRNSNFVEIGIKLIYVFDGTPPAQKKVVIKKRIEAKAKAQVKYEKALAEGKLEKARTYAQATSRIDSSLEQESKKLLSLMGIPWVQAPSEGEAQAAHMSKKKGADFCASQDYDSLLFGAPTLIRNVAITGRRKLPGKSIYVDVLPEVVELRKTIDELGISYEQLIDIGLLIGTDYNPGGVKGIGPKNALKLIKKHGTLHEVLTVIADSQLSIELEKAKDIFLHPKVTNNYKLEWNTPQAEKIVDFLCKEHDFSESRVRRAVEKMERGLMDRKTMTTLDGFFN
jgi:flap endonuclease-1